MGNGSYAASQFLTILLIGRFLGAESVGIYSFALAIVTPLLIFLNFGLRMQLMTDIKGEIPVSVYKKAQFIASSLGVIVSIIICFIFHLKYELSLIILILAIMKAVEYQSELYYGYLQRNKQNKVVSISLFVKSVTFITSVCLGIYFKNTLLQIVVYSAIAYCLVGYFFDKKTIRKKIEIINENLKREYLLKILKIGLPLSLSTLLISLNVNFPRIILGKYDISQLGYFASIVAFMQIGTLLIVSIGQVLSGKMANSYHNGNYIEYYSLARKGIIAALSIGVSFVIFAYLFGEITMNYIFDHSGNLMLYIFILAPFQYMLTIFGYIQGATRKSKNLLFVNILIFISVSILSLLLIPEYKIYGLIVSMFFSFLIGCLIYTFKLLNDYKRKVLS